jgi:hypothetical protein
MSHLQEHTNSPKLHSRQERGKLKTYTWTSPGIHRHFTVTQLAAKSPSSDILNPYVFSLADHSGRPV